jgi:hypothetical protein
MTVWDSFHSLLDYEHLLFHRNWFGSALESITSSASGVRWVTLHSWTLNSITNESLFTTDEWTGWQLQYDWINEICVLFI